jgi:5-formyltetrahydrofolate cyclo-ligase
LIRARLVGILAPDLAASLAASQPMNEHLLAAKADLRRQLRLRARAVAPTEWAEAAARICDRLRQRAEWQRARSVLLFAPLPDELNIWPLALDVLRAGGVLALPRYVHREGCYVAAQVRNPGTDLVPGLLGIREPHADCPVWPLNRLDFVLVPGLGFDKCGGRLGRGKGYYDRLLRETGGVLCGVAMDWQIVPEIPVAPHDRDVACLVTPSRWVSCRRPARD